MTNRITECTQLLGFFADPAQHSFSPEMHNAAFAKLGLDYVYLAFEADEKNIEDAVHNLRILNMRGANVSMPNKTEVIKYLDEIDPVAAMCRAVNTIVNDKGVLKGYNTDGIGFMKVLAEYDVDVRGKKIVVAGAGGAATAVQVQAAMDGVKELSIFNRKSKSWPNALETVEIIREKTDCIVNLYDLEDTERLKTELEDSVLFFNGTSVGMGKLEGKSVIPDASYFHSGMMVADAIYVPEETKMLQMAKSVGCKTMNGLGMLLYQGEEAFFLWTGKKMPVAYVKKVMGWE